MSKFILISYSLAFLLWIWSAIYRWRLARKVEQHTIAGVSLIFEGRYIEALQTFQKLPRSPISLYNIGSAQLGLWRVAYAEASFSFAIAMRRNRHIRTLALPSCSLATALLGRMSDAASQLAECDSIHVGTTPIATLARSVLAARTGHWTEVRELLSRSVMKQLGGCYRGLAEALKTWTTEHMPDSTHSANFDREALFGESDPDAFKVIWPEFHEFLERYKLFAA